MTRREEFIRADTQRLAYFCARFFKSLVREITGEQLNRLQISRIKRNISPAMKPWYTGPRLTFEFTNNKEFSYMINCA